MGMFCYQCQETAKGTGCTVRGVCGKSDVVANLQDLLIFTLKGMSYITEKAEHGAIPEKTMAEVDFFIIEALFSTITNVNFTRDYFLDNVRKSWRLQDGLKKNLPGTTQLPDAATWRGATDDELIEKSAAIGFLSIPDQDIRSLRAAIIYGLKGMSAYAHHAYMLGFSEPLVFAFVRRALTATLDDSLTKEQLIALIVETGKHGVLVMQLLDRANTESYGHPEPTRVETGVGKNPGILISGHDLKDLEELLEQTKGTGVDIYTHGEMLPAHYYPFFRKYDNFIGNYGGSWWHQVDEFGPFNGPVILTTNCLVPPRDSYKDRVYTTGTVGFDGVKHIPDREPGKAKDFSAVIAHAKKCQSPTELENGTITGGYARNAVLSKADAIIDAIGAGKIRKFVVMGGCDGRFPSREYYTDFAKKLPADVVILTAGCAKYRYNKLPLGDIAGIPRVLDAGQCNDSYSLAMIALELAKALKTDVNKLPIAYNIAWYEQKAVIVLLTLLSLGIRNIHIGPTFPGFLSPAVLGVIRQSFGLEGISTVDEDIKLLIG